ncbi:MAG TPA: hypothetical protein VGF82_28290 [Terracidiphilus sp.]
MRSADGTIIEIFEWVSQEAIAGAHSNSVVLALWKRFEAVYQYEIPRNVAEFQAFCSGRIPPAFPQTNPLEVSDIPELPSDLK